MSHIDKEYKKLIQSTLAGTETDSRNGPIYVSTGNQIKLSKLDFPVVSLRKTAWKLALREMEWFLSGSTNINDLHESVHHWWEPWADAKGKIKHSYGAQFSRPGPGGYTQLEAFILRLKNTPFSRRNLMTTWNSLDMASAPIANCHGTVIQAIFKGTLESNSKGFELLMFQRSADVILGVPHNLVQYHALGQYLQHRTGHNFLGLTWVGGNCHLYKDHHEVARKINVFPPEEIRQVCALSYTKPDHTDFRADDFMITRDTYRPIFTDKPKMVV